MSQSLECMSIPAAVPDLQSHCRLGFSFHASFTTFFFSLGLTLVHQSHLRRHRFSDSSPIISPLSFLRSVFQRHILVQNLTIAAAPIVTRKPRSYIVGCRTEGATSQSTFHNSYNSENWRIILPMRIPPPFSLVHRINFLFFLRL